MVVAEPGMFASGDAVDVELALTLRSPRLEHRVPIRFHTGTVEVLGQLLLLDRDDAKFGDEFVARLELDEPVACHPGDRFLLRLQNPVVTVGGGRILRAQRVDAQRRLPNVHPPKDKRATLRRMMNARRCDGDDWR